MLSIDQADGDRRRPGASQSGEGCLHDGPRFINPDYLMRIVGQGLQGLVPGKNPLFLSHCPTIRQIDSQ
jgi:hypothetical protein